MNVRFLRNSDPRFHFVEARAKWFFWLSMIAVMALSGLAMWRLEWFRPVQRLVLVAPSGEGIQPGMPVQLSGFRIGAVKDLQLERADRVRIRVDLFREYAGYVRKDSQASVASGSLIGDRYIALTPGTATSPLVAADDELTLATENSIGRMVEALKDEVRPLIVELRETVKYLNDPEGDLRVSIRQFRSITSVLDKDLPATMAESRGAVKRFDELCSELSDPGKPLLQGLTKLDASATVLNKDLPGLMERFGQSLDKLSGAADDTKKLMKDADKVVMDLDKMVAGAAPAVPGMVKKGGEAVRKADDVINAVRGMWPIRKGVPPEREHLLHVESE
jgi:phospholipid/cholesterol/gamma-HCH transport system substrate-binding protein